MTTAVKWTEPDQRELARSPLINVIWQVRFTPISQLAEGRTALRFQQALQMETTLAAIAAQKISLQMVAGAPMPEQALPDIGSQAWRISAPDGSTHVTLNAGALSVETAQYRTWSSHFLPWVTDAIKALADVADPGLVLRVGMRYINAIFGATLERDAFVDASGLRDVIVPHMLGFLSVPDLGASVDAFQGRHLLKLNDALSHVQHAMVTAENGEVGFLLDIDTYSERTVEFKAADVLSVSNMLHLIGLSVFRQCLTDDAWNSMGPTEDGE